MFDRPYGENPFLGPSQRLTPTIPTRATFQHRVSRRNAETPEQKYSNPPHANRPYRPNSENLNQPFQDNEPATPQPVANENDSVGAVRGSKRMNVAPPGEEHLVKELKKDSGVDNPFALAWWISGRK